jgi:hypothetical protein
MLKPLLSQKMPYLGFVKNTVKYPAAVMIKFVYPCKTIGANRLLVFSKDTANNNPVNKVRTNWIGS